MSLFALALMSVAAAVHASIEPAGLRCEFRVNPLGVDAPRPRLSWRLVSSERDQRQMAYRTLVASSLEALTSNQGDLWDSGIVRSGESLHIPYGGRPLRSGQRVWWKVRVWDAQNRPSAWSTPAFWEMGLLKPEDWQARWICHPAALPQAQPARNGYHSQLARRADEVKWVVIDLGRTRSFDAVRLFPARPFDWKPDTPGFLFPLRFRIEVADQPDFKDKRVVVDRTARDEPNPGTNAPLYKFAPVQARYVRLWAPRLRVRNADYFGLALAEMQVLQGDVNLAKGAQVRARDSIESANWSRRFLVDGDCVSHAGVELPAQSASHFRKEFVISKTVRRARLRASALGLYQLFLNGTRVDNAALVPDWTDYNRRVQYQTYDVTERLRTGSNAVAAWVGDGWYAGRLGMSDGIIGLRRGVYGPKPCFLAQLEIEFTDGSRQIIGTDERWRVTRNGPVRSSDLLDGEEYDARRELAGWTEPGYDDHAWNPAQLKTNVTARLVAQPNEPIRVARELKPIKLTEPRPGVYIFDLGQNMVGRCRLRLRAPRGTAIQLRHGEMLTEQGALYTANLRGARQTDRYLCKGGGLEVFEPHFTYHGFRYVEVTGLSQRPQLEDLTGVVFHSDARRVSDFACSHEGLNRLWTNIVWTACGNLMSVPTDCPQRDERLGWMGDIQAFSQTAIFQFDLAPFFTKWVPDIRDAQTADGRYPDFAPHPYDPETRFSGVPAWGDAGVIVPWRCYINYADDRMLEEHFDSARRWIDYIHGQNPDLIWRHGRGNDYNDWLNANTLEAEGLDNKHGAVPKEVFATAFFAHSTELVARMARVLGREAEARRYQALFEQIRAAFQREFVRPDGRITGDTQAGYALALHFDLLPEAMRPAAAAHLVEGIQAYHGHLSTGIQTTHRAMLELVRWGHEEIAWQVLTNRTFPGWLYMIDQGATTIWERWDGYVRGRGFQNPGMNSFNHWAFGAIGEWMVRHILGLNPDPAYPAYRRFVVHPRPGGGVTWARGRYESIRGPIEIAWRKRDGSLLLDLSVPANATAEVHLPARQWSEVTESNQPVQEAPGLKPLRLEVGTAVIEVGSGEYRFIVQQSQPSPVSP